MTATKDSTVRIWVVLTNAVVGAIGLWVGTIVLATRQPSVDEAGLFFELSIFIGHYILLTGALLGALAGLLVFAVGRLAKFTHKGRTTAKLLGCMVAFLPGLIGGFAPTLLGRDKFLDVITFLCCR